MECVPRSVASVLVLATLTSPNTVGHGNFLYPTLILVMWVTLVVFLEN